MIDEELSKQIAQTWVTKPDDFYECEAAIFSALRSARAEGFRAGRGRQR